MSLTLLSDSATNNKKNTSYIGLQVFDTSSQNDYGVGTIVSQFNYSGEVGVSVAFDLNRLVLNSEGAMSGVIVNGPYSGSINTGGSYVDYQAMVDRSGLDTFQGMIWEPNDDALDKTVETISDYRLKRKNFYQAEVYYFPQVAYEVDMVAVSGVPMYTSGAPLITQLRLL